MAHLVSVNVGGIRAVDNNGRRVTTGIFKEPVTGRVAVRGVNLEGDDQADRNAHGGPVRSIYAYASEDYQWWAAELGRAMPPGTFGENLTTAGIDPNAALVGERWRIGTVLVQVTVPRIPCYKLAMKMGDPQFVRRFADALRPGPYFTILEEGDLAAGDPIEVVHVPGHPLTIREMTRIYLFDRPRLADLLVDDLPESWREWVSEQIEEPRT